MNASYNPRSLFPHLWLLLLALCVLGGTARAQSGFSSGSTGADGTFAPTSSQSIVVPASGVYNFTTVNIPAGVTITFLRNAQNTPLTILASGDVTIAGTLSVAGRDGTDQGAGGLGGPGGFNGGNGSLGFENFNGQLGDGPGGGGGGVAGNPVTNQGTGGGGGGYAAAGGNSTFDVLVANGGQAYGSANLTLLIGGSGGGGGAARAGSSSGIGSGGGGGGGAVVIASSGKITLTGTILADGGNSAGTFNVAVRGSGGGGAGGAIRLIANEVTGNGSLLARGGASGGAGGAFGDQGRGGFGGAGYIRVETTSNTFTGTASPTLRTSPPSSVTSPSLPTLTITKIGNVTTPVNLRASFTAQPDVLLPANLSNPVTVEFGTANIPFGTTVRVVVTASNGATTTYFSSGITGTLAAGAATATVTIPNGMSVLTAAATFTLAQSARLEIQGERIERVEVAVLYGLRSEVTYITASGKRIPAR